MCDKLGRPIYMKFKVVDVKKQVDCYSVKGICHDFGLMDFIIEEDIPKIGTEFSISFEWPEDISKE